MKNPAIVRVWSKLLLISGTCALLGATHPSRADDARVEARYPYDPACAWGRVADGRGMLVRCLTQAESQSLRAPSPRSPAPAAAAAPSAVVADVKATLGPIEVDNGSLPEAIRKLGSARARFEGCVKQHGGLKQKEGEVQVTFLVRERGRAEGVGVGKRVGVSEAAARCVADVVDRRAVGLPDAPLVAAKLVVKFQRQGQ